MDGRERSLCRFGGRRVGRRASASFAICLAALATVACAAQSDHQDGRPTGPASASPRGSAGPSSAAPPTGPISGGLAITLTRMHSGATNVVFPADRAAAAEPFVTQTAYPADVEAFEAREYQSGAAAQVSLLLYLTLETQLDAQVTVTYVRIVNRKRTEVPVGGYLIGLYTSQGDAPGRMAFELDDANPFPRALDEELHPTDRPFFDTADSIHVGRAAKQELILLVEAHRGNYAFGVQVEYEVNGRKFRADVVHAPFLVTGQHCGFTKATVYEPHPDQTPRLEQHGADFLPC